MKHKYFLELEQAFAATDDMQKEMVNEAVGVDQAFKDLYVCGICKMTVYQPVESNCGCQNGIFCTMCLMELQFANPDY